jgi:hypothetical protein
MRTLQCARIGFFLAPEGDGISQSHFTYTLFQFHSLVFSSSVPFRRWMPLPLILHSRFVADVLDGGKTYKKQNVKRFLRLSAIKRTPSGQLDSRGKHLVMLLWTG